MILFNVLVLTPAIAANRFTLVIGNGRYIHLGSEQQFKRPLNDARAVGDALEHDGFVVTRGSNLGRSEMVDAVYTFTDKLGQGDTALFYYAGHGVTLGGGNYLLPSDIPSESTGQELRIASDSVAEADIVASLQEKRVRVAILILDACRDNPFRRPGVRSLPSQRGLGRVMEATGVFSLYSAGIGQSSLDSLSDTDENPNSVFTRVLVPLLTRPGLNLDDLAYEVREGVATLAATSSDHHEQVPASYNQIVGGRVYLAPAAASSAEIVAPPRDLTASRLPDLPAPT